MEKTTTPRASRPCNDAPETTEQEPAIDATASPTEPTPASAVTVKATRPDPDEEYKRVAGMTREEWREKRAAMYQTDRAPGQATIDLHTRAENARQDAMRKHPAYWLKEFCKHARMEYEHECKIAETAEHLMLSLSAQALEMGNACNIVPKISGFSDSFESFDCNVLSRACSGPVILTAEAAPVLIRFLRASLVRSEAETYRDQWKPFAWESLGDDSAVDWDNPATVRDFVFLFERYLKLSSYIRGQWIDSGLTVDDLIDHDLSNELGAFSLTIIPAVPGVEPLEDEEDED